MKYLAICCIAWLVLTFTALDAGDSGYELIAREIKNGHAAKAVEVRRVASESVDALVWMIAWDPDDPGDTVFAADWLTWARDGNIVTTEFVGGLEVERLIQAGSSVTYLLATTEDTALLIADLGGRQAVTEALITSLT